VKQHPKRAWGIVGGVAAALLIISMLTVKLEFPGHGGLTSSPRSACSYAGEAPCISPKHATLIINLLGQSIRRSELEDFTTRTSGL
jgi:ABC-type Co2+ transport system permease subunit